MIDIWLLIQHLHGAPVFPGERFHDNTSVVGVFHDQSQCTVRRIPYESHVATQTSGNTVIYECRRISLDIDDFEGDGKFAPCSHLQPSDMALMDIQPTESIHHTCGRDKR